MRLSRSLNLSFVLSIFALVNCAHQSSFTITYEKYKLDNGLEIILHEDGACPIVSIAVLYHVGSGREDRGRTGLAHLSEHMMFLGSQHVGPNIFDKRIKEAGGWASAMIFEDGTFFFEVIPSHALEMTLWLESDRMGWLLGGISEDVFENEKKVLINENREHKDNVPYGLTSEIIRTTLYSPDHPYSFGMDGSLEDLRNAKFKDFKRFFKKWYGPNNATLVIAGDFNIVQTKEWVGKYFGEIKSITENTDPDVRLARLNGTKRIYHEDDLAKSPELNLVFPTLQMYARDSYALDYLGSILADSKKSPLHQVIVEERKLAPSVWVKNHAQEIAGHFQIKIKAFPNVKLTDVERAIFEAFQEFEKNGFTENDLEKLKIKFKTDYYINNLSIFWNKTFELALHNEFNGSPSYIIKHIQNIDEIKSGDIWRVYKKYIKDKSYVLTSFVPQGKNALIAENSIIYPVVGESTESQSEEEKNIEAEWVPSIFDRSLEPPKGPRPIMKIPIIWKHTLGNGLQIIGIEHHKLPLIYFSLVLRGGLLLENTDLSGVSNMLSKIMMEGTTNKTPVELEDAIDNLGATISIQANDQSIVIQVHSLSFQFEKIYKIVEEILLKPRWDQKEFERIKIEMIEEISRQKTQPYETANKIFKKLVYGDNNILSRPNIGFAESIERITIDDLKKYYESNFSPSITHISLVGDISKKRAINVLKSLERKWANKPVVLPKFHQSEKLEKSEVYFVDFPNATQSEIRIGNLALSPMDEEFFPATVMNYKLSDTLLQILRGKKGYTYHAWSSFNKNRHPGTFMAGATVQFNATLDSVKIFKNIMTEYRKGISNDELASTKIALLNEWATLFENIMYLRGMLDEIVFLGLSNDYIIQQEEYIKQMTLGQHQALAGKYIEPDKMIYLILGDAKTQFKPLNELGFGQPILLDRDGNRK